MTLPGGQPLLCHMAVMSTVQAQDASPLSMTGGGSTGRVVTKVEDAAEEAASGLRGWFGSTAQKSKAAVEACGSSATLHMSRCESSPSSEFDALAHGAGCGRSR